MSVRLQGGKSGGHLSWLGLAAIIGGMTLIWLYFSHPYLVSNDNVVYALMYLGAGGALIAWGVRSLSEEVWAFFRHLQKRASHRYRVTMPREALIYGFILAVLCAGALMGGSNMLMLVFGLMAGPFVLNGQVTLGIIRRLSITRNLPEHATVGESFRVKLTLTNRKWVLSSWMVSVEDPVHSRREQLLPVVLFACVPPSSTREAIYEICPAVRGVYEFGPMRVVSRFPLGLMERSVELGNIQSLTVFPQVGRMLPRWRQSVDAGEPVADAACVATGTHSDEFHTFREYRTGDTPRSIHWRTTARLNQLMVREYQHSRRYHLLLAVDLWLPARPTPADFERVELAVSFAASICADHLQQTSDSSLAWIVNGRELVSGTGASSPAALAGILEQLALVEGGPANQLVAAAQAAALDSLRGVRKLLVTTRPEASPASDSPVSNNPRTELADANFEVLEADPAFLSQFIEYN